MSLNTVPLSGSFPHHRLNWMDGAACRHSGMHTPEHRLQAMCAVCTVATPCLEWALERREIGYWAGTDEDDRNRIRRERRADTEAPVTVRRAVDIELDAA